MTDKDLELLYKNDKSLEPRPEIKEEILARAQKELLKNGVNKRKATPIYKRLKLWLPVAACLVIMLTIFGGAWGLKSEHYQTVYIDVNPSVAVMLNRFGSVSGVECLNDDAKEILNDTNLEGKSAEEALEIIIDTYATQGYFEKEADILISAEQGEDELVNRLKQHAEAIKGNKKYKVSTQFLSQEEKEAAKDAGISPGKYRIISQIVELSSDYTVAELEGLSMSELNKLYKSLTKPNKK